MPEGIYRCCGGYAEHFDYCELGRLEQQMRRQGVIQYDPRLDQLDADDRAWVQAQEVAR
jgi:hypothetical protein